MQDGCRILGSGKSGKMAKRYQHHKFPPCLGYPKHEGKDKENLTHFFRHYQENRLMVLSDNGKTSRYTYNAAGERIMKSYGTMEGVYINGAAKETAIRVHTIQVPGTICG